MLRCAVISASSTDAMLATPVDVTYYLADGCRRPDGRGHASARGKSGLRRARCQVTPGRCRKAPTDSATENRPPMASVRRRTGKGETVG